MENDLGLPQDVLEEILQRLPYKLLSRFRCVCKFWNSLLSGPLFIPSRLSYFIKHHTYHNSAILSLYLSGSSSKRSYQYRLLSLSSKKGSSSSSVSCSYLPSARFVADKFRISGHCNGILCLSISSWLDDIKVALYNPTTHELKWLPNSVLQAGKYSSPTRLVCRAMAFSSYCFNCGMGYDLQSDDYKVVRIWFDNTVEEYSLRTDSWTILNNSNAKDFMFYGGSFALFFKGTYYWWASRRGQDHDYSSTLILGLNIGDEVFRPVPVPDEVDMRKPRNLVFWGNSIALICCIEIPGLNLSWIDIWVMTNNSNAFGSDEAYQVSWTKTHSIAPKGLLEDPKPLIFWEDNELLLETSGGEIKSFNVDSEEIKNLEIDKHLLSAQAVNYVATPVKIKGATYLLRLPYL